MAVVGKIEWSKMNKNPAEARLFSRLISYYLCSVLIISILSFVVTILLTNFQQAFQFSLYLGGLLGTAIFFICLIYIMTHMISSKTIDYYLWCPEKYEITNEGIKLILKYTSNPRLIPWKDIGKITNLPLFGITIFKMSITEFEYSNGKKIRLGGFALTLFKSELDRINYYFNNKK